MSYLWGNKYSKMDLGNIVNLHNFNMATSPTPKHILVTVYMSTSPSMCYETDSTQKADMIRKALYCYGLHSHLSNMLRNGHAFFTF